MRTNQTFASGARSGAGERGLALIMALMALAVLTVLGLTLAATTATEQQVAANYRWSLQALYNAEAGLEVAKSELRTLDWATALPPPRPITDVWVTTDPPVVPNFPGFTGGRNYEMGSCDGRGHGMGYGVILNGLENQTVYQTLPLHGSFTVWVRWPVDMNVVETGTNRDVIADYQGQDAVIVVSEGTAPGPRYQGGVNEGKSVNVAAQIIEATIYSDVNLSKMLCGQRTSMAGSGPGGAGLDPCRALRDAADGTGAGPSGIQRPNNSPMP